jgi:hypothetical protein
MIPRCSQLFPMERVIAELAFLSDGRWSINHKFNKSYLHEVSIDNRLVGILYYMAQRMTL